jgi:hypothetical protein
MHSAWSQRILLAPEGEGGGAGAEDGGGEKRKAHAAVVDQVADLSGRVSKLEQGWLDRLFADGKTRIEAKPEGKKGDGSVPAPPRAPTLLEELEEAIDPFNIFGEEPAPKPRSEAPAVDEGA